jgi:amino acid adenylation domain-containing protein
VAGLLSRLRAVARETPRLTAVRGTDKVLTFAELDAHTSRLASVLRSNGYGQGHRVGVSLRRGADLLVALLAVWRAGAAYVPLDPTYPAARLAFMAADAGISALVAQDNPEWTDVVLVRPDDQAAPAADRDVSARMPAYVMYTSGSTGTPKGVEITHGAVESLVDDLERSSVYAAEHRVVAWNASVSFDASVQQWVRVCRGDTLVVLDDAHRMDPVRLRAWLTDCGVTDLDLTPTHWEMLRTQLLTPFPDGRVLRLFMGGEPVPPDTWREIAAADGVEAVNLYGPTECTVDATVAWITGEEPHIGRPLPGNQLHILDDHLEPVAPGATGELYIAGPRLATGYVNRPAATAERFLPGLGGGRMYRTGDRVRLAADGTLIFVERTDSQVKVRGFRVERAEIEHHAASHQDVARAVVVLRGERLVAYLVPVADRLPSHEQMTDYLRAGLPEFMVPSDFVRVDELPLTPNGKLDLAALPEPDSTTGLAVSVADLVTRTWADVLGQAGIEPEDDFFALGGRSLAAVRVVAQLKETLGVAVPTREVYRRPRLRDFAEYVESAHGGERE